MTEENNTELSGVIFDMDGTLVDSEPLHARSWQELLEKFGLHMDFDWFVPWIGIPDRDLAAHLTENYEQLPQTAELLSEKREIYRELVRRELGPFPGLVEEIEKMLAMGLKLAVATSSSANEAKNTLTAAGLLKYFPVVVGSCCVENHKPDPEPFLHAAKLIGLDAGECAAIEDSSAGVASASAAGCITLAVTTTHPAKSLAQATHTFNATVDAARWIIDRKKVSTR